MKMSNFVVNLNEYFIHLCSRDYARYIDKWNIGFKIGFECNFWVYLKFWRVGEAINKQRTINKLRQHRFKIGGEKCKLWLYYEWIITPFMNEME